MATTSLNSLTFFNSLEAIPETDLLSLRSFAACCQKFDPKLSYRSVRARLRSPKLAHLFTVVDGDVGFKAEHLTIIVSTILKGVELDSFSAKHQARNCCEETIAITTNITPADACNDRIDTEELIRRIHGCAEIRVRRIQQGDLEERFEHFHMLRYGTYSARVTTTPEKAAGKYMNSLRRDYMELAAQSLEAAAMVDSKVDYHKETPIIFKDLEPDFSKYNGEDCAGCCIPELMHAIKWHILDHQDSNRRMIEASYQLKKAFEVVLLNNPEWHVQGSVRLTALPAVLTRVINHMERNSPEYLTKDGDQIEQMLHEAYIIAKQDISGSSHFWDSERLFVTCILTDGTIPSTGTKETDIIAQRIADNEAAEFLLLWQEGRIEFVTGYDDMRVAINQAQAAMFDRLLEEYNENKANEEHYEGWEECHDASELTPEELKHQREDEIECAKYKEMGFVYDPAKGVQPFYSLDEYGEPVLDALKQA